MGKNYAEPFRQLVRELGHSKLKAFIVADGIDPRYQEHILDTLNEMGVPIALTTEEANFVIDGYVEREDGVVGLEIDTERMGRIDLFPDGAAIPASL
jgi:hypothetical protein